MSRPFRIISAILVLGIILGAVTGIAYWTAGIDTDAPDPGVFIDGKKMENPPAILTFGETPVPFEVYRHYFLLYKSYFTSYYGPDFYSDENDPDGDRVLVLKQSVETELLNLYTWLEIAAQEGIELNDEERAEINATLEEQRQLHGDNFEKQLNNMYYLNEADYLKITEMQRLAEKAKTTYREKLEKEHGEEFGTAADEDFEANFISAKHILIMAPTDVEDPDASLEEARVTAQAIYDEIMASDDPAATFNELMVEKSEDTGGLESNPDGYTFKKGDMVEIFYETALALDIGAISEPVLSDAENYRGFHIIMRMPLNEEARTANREQAVSTKIDELVAEREAAVQETMTVTYSDFYDRFLAGDIR